MPVDHSAGYSAVTPIKLAHLQYIIGTWFRLTSGPKFRYAPRAHRELLYWDLNSGPGFVNGERGSPLVFLDEARKCGEPFRAWFHERDAGACESLRYAIGGGWSDRVAVIPGDHRTTVPAILATAARYIPRRAYGIAFADPNGRDDLPIAPLRAIGERFPKVDFVVNLSAMAWKRIRSVGKPGRFLSDDLAQIPKQFTLIRRPVGPWQFAMFLFTNYRDAPSLKKLGFYDIGSRAGQEILRTLDLLPREYYQSPLFDLEPLRRTRPMPSISDIRATEPSAPMPSPDAAASASVAAISA